MPLTGAPNARQTLAPPPAVIAPPNGDLSLGLEGWSVQAREPAPIVLRPDGGPAVRLAMNATLLSPSFLVPPGVQAIAVRARAPGVGALLEVSARPDDGGPDIALAVLEPGAGFGEGHVPLTGLAGRTVRLVLDPVPALGRVVEVAGVGPLLTPLPLWTPTAGVPVPERVDGRQALRVSEDPLALVSLPFGRGPGARALLVAVRGEGRLSADAGGGPATLAVRGSPVWRDLRVPLPFSGGPVTLAMRATPGAADLLVADLGLVLRATALAGRRVSREGRALRVRGRLVPAGGGLIVELSFAGRRLATARTGSGGRFSLRLGDPPGGTRAGVATISTPGDRTRLPARWGVRLSSTREGRK